MVNMPSMLKVFLGQFGDTTLETASEEIQNSRIEICKNCEYYFAPTTTCKKCGCFMMIKVKLLNAKCPMDKWQINIK